MTDPDSPASRHHPTRGLDGRLILAGTAVGCVVLFFVVWASLRSVEHHLRDNRPELHWQNRADWLAPAVIRTTLVKPNAANAQYTYNKPRYRDPGLTLPPDEEQAVLALADLARAPDFSTDTARQGVLQLAGSGENFYAQYLLATLHELNGETDEANAAYQRATNLAPKILVVQYNDPTGNPVPHLKLGRIEIGCDRVTDGGQTLDQRLVLVYPAQQTDAAGRVYLPLYHTTARPVVLPQTDGYTITYTPPEGWFDLPSHVGMITAIVRSESGPS